MILTINEQQVTVEVVDYLGNNDGTFHADTNTIRILKNASDIKAVAIHELTHAYIWYYGFGGGVNLEEELICNFFERYGERIINDANKIVESMVN